MSSTTRTRSGSFGSEDKKQEDKLSIASFIPAYPEFDISTISQKKEFYDLRQTRGEDTKLPNGLLKHQELIKRLLSGNTPYNQMLLFHGMGSGKTCASLAVSEYYLNMPEREFGRAIVLVQNTDLMESYEKDLSDVCTNMVYVAHRTKREEKYDIQLKPNVVKGRIRREIAKRYEINTYYGFLSRLPRNPDGSIDEEQVRSYYSNRVIIVDEVHNLKEDSSKEVEINLYDDLHTFLHAVKGCVTLLLSGTLVWDSPHEICGVLNLLLPVDQQLPTSTEQFNKIFFKGDILTERGQTLLRNAVNGRVSYVRSDVSSVDKTDVGIKGIWTKNLVVYPTVMGSEQAKVFASVYAMGKKDETEDTDVDIDDEIEGEEGDKPVKKKGAWFEQPMNASNFVIPGVNGEGSSDKDKKLFGSIKGKAGAVWSFPRDMKRHLTGDSSNLKTQLSHLSEYSGKFAAIIDCLENNKDINGNPEAAFVYNSMVSTPGGAVIFGLCLELFGYKRISNPSDLEILKDGVKRYAIVTGNYSIPNCYKGNVQALLDKFNHKDNKYGGLIKVIIGSAKLAIGHTIKNVRQIHITTPHWNVSKTEQALFRGLRYGSHNALPEGVRYVKIYRHVSVYGGIGKTGVGIGYPSATPKRKDDTLDIYMYKTAEDKEFKTLQIYRVIKKASVDCALNYERNVSPFDHDGSRECDFTDCNYECYGYPPTSKPKKGVWSYKVDESELDRSTYDLLYSQPERDKYIEGILKYFKTHFRSTIKELREALGVKIHSQTVFLDAISEVISKYIVPNRYGFDNFLVSDGDTLFLSESFEGVSKLGGSLTSIYASNPYVIEKRSLDEYQELFSYVTDKDAVRELCRSPSLELFESLNYKTQVMLFEVVYQNMHVRKAEKRKATVSEKKIESIICSHPAFKYYGIEELNMDVHILYGQEYTGVEYAVPASKYTPFGRARGFDLDKKEWRTLTPEEEKIALLEISIKEEDERLVGFEDNPYGVMGWVAEGKGEGFRIQFRPTGKGGVGGINRGMKCSSYTLPELWNLVANTLKRLPPVETYGTGIQSMLSNVEGVKTQIVQTCGNNDARRKPLIEWLGARDWDDAGVILSKMGKTDKEKMELLKFFTLQKMRKDTLCEYIESLTKELGIFKQ